MTLDEKAGTAPQWVTAHGSVARIRTLTPSLMEVTLAGFGATPLVGGDEFVYVMVSTVEGGLPASYTIDDFMRRDPHDPVRGAYYTVRRFRPSSGEVDLWAVRHGHTDSVADWFAQATPGAPVAWWGPRSGYDVPTDARHVLLVADETGFAAVAALLELLPAACRATAVLETVDPRHRLEMPPHPGLSVVWVDRGADAPGEVNRLLTAVEALTSRPDTAFGAGESRQITAVRRHVRDALGIPADRVSMTGYWRLAEEA